MICKPAEWTFKAGFAIPIACCDAQAARSEKMQTEQFFDFQKKRGVHKISARNSGAGNGCANFMGAWHFLVLSAGKPPCP